MFVKLQAYRYAPILDAVPLFGVKCPASIRNELTHP
jgi:hypothetical protein